MAIKATSFRFKEKTIEHLNVLSTTLNTTATELLEGLINIEFDKIMGNPELMKIIEQMSELKSVMEGYKQSMTSSEVVTAAPRSKSARIAATPPAKKASKK